MLLVVIWFAYAVGDVLAFADDCANSVNINSAGCIEVFFIVFLSLCLYVLYSIIKNVNLEVLYNFIVKNINF